MSKDVCVECVKVFCTTYVDLENIFVAALIISC